MIGARPERPLARAYVEELFLADFGDVVLMVVEALAGPHSNDGHKLRAAAKLIHARLHRKGLDRRSVLAAYDAWRRQRDVHGSSWADDRWFHPDRKARAHRLNFDGMLGFLEDRRILARDAAEWLSGLPPRIEQ